MSINTPFCIFDWSDRVRVRKDVLIPFDSTQGPPAWSPVTGTPEVQPYRDPTLRLDFL